MSRSSAHPQPASPMQSGPLGPGSRPGWSQADSQRLDSLRPALPAWFPKAQWARPRDQARRAPIARQTLASPSAERSSFPGFVTRATVSRYYHQFGTRATVSTVHQSKSLGRRSPDARRSQCSPVSQKQKNRTAPSAPSAPSAPAAPPPPCLVPPAAGCQLLADSCQLLLAASCQLPAAGCWLPVSSCLLLAAGC